MAVELKWHGMVFKTKIKAQIAAGLKAAAVELHRIARLMTDVRNEAVGVVRQRSLKTAKRASDVRFRATYPHSSKPGEPLRRRTGFGQKNIVWSFSRSGMFARVGYTAAARYMTFHELGIRYKRVGLQKRPTIIPALSNNWQRLAAIAQIAAKGAAGGSP